MSEELPQSIGKYGIVGIAGRGAQGLVYQAHDPFIDRAVAIKVWSKAPDSDVDEQEQQIVEEPITVGSNTNEGSQLKDELAFRFFSNSMRESQVYDTDEMFASPLHHDPELLRISSTLR